MMRLMTFLMTTTCLVGTGLAAAPTVVSPVIGVLPPYDTNSNMYLGSITKIELNVSFPIGSTPSVSIELLPSTNETIMALGEVTVTHVGSNTGVTMPTLQKIEADETKNKGVKVYTRGVFAIGDVINGGGSANDIENTIKIEFEAYLVSTGSYADNDIHWCSVGVEYNDSFNVWVGQLSFTIKTTAMPTSKVPSFALTGGTNVAIGSFAKFEIDAKLPYGFSSYDAEGISLSTDESLRVVSIKVKSAGTNYAFSFDLDKLYSYGVNCTTDKYGSRRVRIEMGKVPNKGAAIGTTTTAADQILFEITVLLNNNATQGDIYPLGVGVEIDSSEVWVSYTNITATAPLGDSGTVTAVHELPNGDKVPIGGMAIVNVNVTFPEETSQRYTIAVESTEKTLSKDPAIQVLTVVPVSQGLNVPCPDVETKLEMSKPETGFSDKGNCDANVTNFGALTSAEGPSANVVVFRVLGIVIATRATEGDVHKIKITLTGGVGGPVAIEVELTIEGTMNFTNPVVYQFLLYHKCDKNCMAVGTYFDFYLDVTTQRDTNPGQVTVEFPVPSNISNSIFSVCEFEVFNVGKNVPCVSNSLAKASANLTKYPDGSYERVVLDINPLCNVASGTEAADDKFSLRMRVKIYNDTDVKEGITEYYGIGVKYSETQVWVAQIDVDPKKATYFPGLAIVEGVAVEENNYTFPGIIEAQSSLTGETFIPANVAFGSPTSNGTHDIYTFDKPYITSYTRLASSTVCKENCYIEHEFVTTTLNGFLDIFEDKDNALLQQFALALDKDTGTCFNLPIQGNKPPLLWARLNTTILSIDQRSFRFNVTGVGINCDPHEGNRVLQVSYPTASASTTFHVPAMKFCELENPTDVPNGLHTCQFSCVCPDATHCGEVYMFLSNYVRGDTSSWSLCEVSAVNV